MTELIPLDNETVKRHCANLRATNPLIQCLTNDVVQEITANVLLAAGASPAMVVAKEESATFTAIASGLLVNIGTPTTEMMESMRLCAKTANELGKVWVLDPVAAGCIAWRDEQIRSCLVHRPTVIRGNASEIKALAGVGNGGKGVDSTDASSSAIEAAKSLAKDFGSIVCVTGETDYVTDGEKTVFVEGGDVMATLVVGTGCSLSALMAAFVASNPEEKLMAAASCCAVAKRSAEIAIGKCFGPGSFKVRYLDALYEVTRNFA